MAKKTTQVINPKAPVSKAVEEVNKQLATVAGGPPASIAKLASTDAGKGVSTDQSDNMVPLVYILQPLSPQVDKRAPEFIDGAGPGDIWLRNHSEPIIGGEEGLVFQPCFFSKDWVEWRPRAAGGGMMGRFNEPPSDTEQVPHPANKDRTILVRKNGNEMIETRYHVGRAKTATGWVPYVIPFKSTGHTVSRQWMFLMNSKLVDGQKAPSWASLYRLTTKQRTNASGTWFVFDVADAGWVQSEEDYLEGKKLFEAFNAGAKVIADDDVAEEHDTGGDRPM